MERGFPDSVKSKNYSFAHPLLAQEFKGALGRQASLAEAKLIDYCAKWQELERSDYGLRYYAEHLGLAKRWGELYELARNQEFVTAQRQHLREQPDLPLKTVQIALSGAVETFNPKKLSGLTIIVFLSVGVRHCPLVST